MYYYVYILKSISSPKQIYVGFTTDIHKRLEYHNKGLSYHTSKFIPWEIETSIVFTNRELALSFEKYLKVGSGNAFMKKRLIKSSARTSKTQVWRGELASTVRLAHCRQAPFDKLGSVKLTASRASPFPPTLKLRSCLSCSTFRWVLILLRALLCLMMIAMITRRC